MISTSLGALIDGGAASLQTGPFGTVLRADEYTTYGVPLISTREIGFGTISLHDSTPRVNQAVLSRLPRYILAEGDIIFARKGAVDRNAVVRAEESGWFLGSDGIRLRVDRTVVVPEYLHYAFQDRRTREWLTQQAGGTTMPSLNEPTLRRLPLLLPEIGIQLAIAQSLGLLDEKIALNRRLNRTLEATATALFRSWFVDFDPVIAKIEGRPALGVPEAVHMLMPSRMADDPVAPIPDGWRWVALADEFSISMGQSPPGSSYNDVGEGVAFFQGCTDFGFRYPSRRLFTTAPKKIAERNDTLVSVRAPVGRVNMAGERCCVGRGLAAVRHRSGSRSYTYYAMRSLEGRFSVFEGEGTLFGAITRDGFAKLPIIQPTGEVIDAFEGHVGALDERISLNENENLTLANLRDALLPELLSGAIHLRDAERTVAMAI